MVMKRIAIVLLLLLAGVSCANCYGKGLRDIFRKRVTIRCYWAFGKCYYEDNSVLDMVSGYPTIKDTLEKNGLATMVSKIDSSMIFFYHKVGKDVECYKVLRSMYGDWKYFSYEPASLWFEDVCCPHGRFNVYLGEFKIKR